MSSIKSHRTRMGMLEVARRLLDERGFSAVTMEDIAIAAGVSRQAVYLHFGSRGGLLVALARYIDEMDPPPAELYQRLVSAPTALAMVETGIEIGLHFESRVHTYAHALQSLRQSDPAAQAAWEDRMAARRSAVGRIAARLAAEGLLAPGWSEREAGDFIFNLLSVDSYQTLVVELGWPVSTYGERMRDAIVGTLFAPRSLH